MDKNSIATIFFGIYFIGIIQLKYCAGSPDWSYLKDGEVTGLTIQKIADALKERARTVTGDVNNLDLTNVFFRRLSKIGSVTGGLLSWAFIFVPDNSHSELLKQFERVHEGINNLDTKLDDTQRLIKRLHHKSVLIPDINKIKNAAKTHSSYLKHPDTFKRKLKEYGRSNELRNALFNVLRHTYESDLIKTLYDDSFGDLNEIEKFRWNIRSLLFVGNAAKTEICLMIEEDGGSSKKTAEKRCIVHRLNELEEEEERMNKEFDKWAGKAKSDYGSNIKRFIGHEFGAEDVSHIKFAYSSSLNLLRDRMSVALKRRYGWLDHQVTVYTQAGAVGVSGYENHAMVATAHEYRFHDKINWFVLAEMNDKDHQLGRKNFHEKLRSLVSNARCGSSRCMDSNGSAKDYFNSVRKLLNENKYYVFGLAVIRKSNYHRRNDHSLRQQVITSQTMRFAPTSPYKFNNFETENYYIYIALRGDHDGGYFQGWK